MAKGFQHGAGGVGLNFKVVGGTSAPTNPRENTLWVKTNVAITRYVFQVTQPTGAEGMVWIPTYTYSPAPFNALKQNTIELYPIGAMQYLSGSWVNKPAQIYRGNGWVDLFLYLYNQGSDNIELTGGWSAVAKGYDSGAPDGTTPQLTNTGGMMTIDFTTDVAGGMVYAKKKINLSGYNKLKLDGIMTATNGASTFCGFGVWTGIGTYQVNNRVAWFGSDHMDSVKSLDISSLNGEHYIGFYLFRKGSSVKIRRMWLEK